MYRIYLTIITNNQNKLKLICNLLFSNLPIYTQQIESKNQPKSIKFIEFYPYKVMQLLAYRALFTAVSSNQHLIKSIAPLAKINHIQYPFPQQNTNNNTTNLTNKKARCWLCNCVYDHVLMLIMHLEIIHPNMVEKYLVRNQSLIIILNPNPKYKQRERDPLKMQNQRIDTNIAGGCIVGLAKNTAGTGISKNSYGMQFMPSINFIDNSPTYIKNRLMSRVRAFVSNIVFKIQKTFVKTQQVYFHSSNIFKRVVQEEVDQDSQDDIGQVQRQLQKLRIQDFSDVNDNDKKFFILWNGFIHDSRKKLNMIYLHDMPNLFVQFSGIAQKKGIPRINLVMHAWTLWSVGQISSNDVIRGLSQYDQSAEASSNKNRTNSTIVLNMNNADTMRVWVSSNLS